MSAGARRLIGFLSAGSLFLSTTALSAPADAGLPPSAALATSVTVVAAPVTEPTVPETFGAPPETAANASPAITLPSTTTTTTTIAEPDPTGDDILAHHSTTTVPGDVVTSIIDDSEGLWASGLQLAAVVPAEALPDLRVPATGDECYERAKSIPLNGDHERNLIAQMTHWLFECVATVDGLAEVEPTSTRHWDGRKEWGFQSLAEQVAAEAVTVAYCESVGFKPSALRRSNPWGYAGLFQIGSSEFKRFSGIASNRFDVVDNAYAAVRYFLHQYRNRGGWGGWSPWAVVNTNFDGVNDQVKVPILPRFASTQAGYRGRHGPELPAWAVDPWVYEVPSWSGCPYTGGRWAASDKL